MVDVVDLTADLPQDTFELQMLRPGTATPNGWVITLAGPAHPKAVAYKNQAQRDRLQKEASVEASQMNGRKVKPDAKTPDEDDMRTVKWLVSRIVTWTPIKIGAETIAFSDDAATLLFLRPVMAPYVNQVAEYLAADNAFMPASANS
jgi:hypothetical protein